MTNDHDHYHLAATCWYSCKSGSQSESVWNPSSVSSASKIYIPAHCKLSLGGQANLQSFTLPTTYFGRPMGPGPWVVELSGLVVTRSGVVVTASVAVAVIVVPASAVSSLTVVVGIVLSVAGADVELVDGGLEAQT